MAGGGPVYNQGEPLLVATSRIDELFESVEISGEIPRFYSRTEWGANEKLRLKSFFNTVFRAGRKLPPEAENLPISMKPTIVTSKLDGEDLFWPVEENKVIKKIVIHHTAEAVDERRAPMTLMRAIYYFHTKVREWGDIGYNFVIDKQGNVYEGRAGGPRAVGAHTAFYNTGTVGVALMGNFQKEHPTRRQLRSLEILIAHIVMQEKIDPTGSQTFLGTDSGNISGHRDVAVEGHGTACPGKHLHTILPEIRTNVATFIKQIEGRRRTTARDRISRSSTAVPVERGSRDDTEIPALDIPEIAFDQILKPTPIRRGESTVITVSVKNGTDYSWPRGSTIKVGNVPDGMIMTPFISVEDVRPGSSGLFRSKLRVDGTPNGHYDIALQENLAAVKEQSVSMSIPIQVSGDTNNFFKSFQTSTIKRSRVSMRDIKNAPSISRNTTPDPLQRSIMEDATQYGPKVKIKLAIFDGGLTHITSKDWVKISNHNNTLYDAPPDSVIKLIAKNEGVQIEVDDKTFIVSGTELKTFSQDGILKISNYDRGLGTTPYNQFRRQLNIYKSSTDKLLIVNELPMEQYLWGLAEEPSSEPIHKKHAIHVLARSYALVYSGSKRKFGTVLYDLEDDPRTSQFYLGYDWERYHIEQKAIVAQTHGEVITYDGTPVIGPYFTQSAGRSSDIWHSQYPWTRAQELPYDKGLEQKGHGVGLSGNSARMLAQKGEKYPAILNYFFEGIALDKAY
ncbi:MAG TPA: N-acetylmuramoyl-L-alanine amidase [Candidatus Gracilibacteria bacterium]